MPTIDFISDRVGISRDANGYYCVVARASGTPTPTWSVSTGTLPSGLVILSADGFLILTGTPETETEQTADITFTASSGSDNSVSDDVTIIIT